VVSGDTTMIEFSCDRCGRQFSVGGDFAGRRARCKGCGSSLIVPGESQSRAEQLVGSSQAGREAESGVGASETNSTPSAHDPVHVDTKPAHAALPPMRIRRLMADHEQLKLLERSEVIRVTPLEGSPPESYRVEYHVQGLERGEEDQPRARAHHVVEIRLTSDYPRLSPQCRMLTPVFHPNISPEGTTICIGDHWTAGERLADLVVRIGEMLAYQAYNIRSPLDGEAAMWADLNPDQLPTDRRELLPRS
jgi:ubiquitin-protein ligase/DNA-directed RNA polymerase subunit RPC12/RpoP